ncbi:MAG: hypothetical protein PHQ23_09025 [Candidatus Wallbacteria bacterium]|nr:hypothetical protein [Candidatus Wallbacteria bacterium]
MKKALGVSAAVLGTVFISLFFAGPAILSKLVDRSGSDKLYQLDLPDDWYNAQKSAYALKFSEAVTECVLHGEPGKHYFHCPETTDPFLDCSYAENASNVVKLLHLDDHSAEQVFGDRRDVFPVIPGSSWMNGARHSACYLSAFARHCLECGDLDNARQALRAVLFAGFATQRGYEGTSSALFCLIGNAIEGIGCSILTERAASGLLTDFEKNLALELADLHEKYSLTWRECMENEKRFVHLVIEHQYRTQPLLMFAIDLFSHPGNKSLSRYDQAMAEMEKPGWTLLDEVSKNRAYEKVERLTAKNPILAMLVIMGFGIEEQLLANKAGWDLLRCAAGFPAIDPLTGSEFGRFESGEVTVLYSVGRNRIDEQGKGDDILQLVSKDFRSKKKSLTHGDTAGERVVEEENRYTNRDQGFSVTLPQGWLVERIDSWNLEYAIGPLKEGRVDCRVSVRPDAQAQDSDLSVMKDMLEKNPDTADFIDQGSELIGNSEASYLTLRKKIRNQNGEFVYGELLTTYVLDHGTEKMILVTYPDKERGGLLDRVLTDFRVLD